MYDDLRGLLHRMHDNDVIFFWKSKSNDGYEYGPMCDDMCRMASMMMCRGSEYVKQMCEMCADMCEACATECEKMGSSMDMCKQCADACRRCAQECRNMMR